MQYPEVIHTPTFVRSSKGELDEDELRELELTLAKDPELGDVMGETGGVRKVRVALGSRGKRAGARVCYYYRKDPGQVFLLYLFRKSDKENLTKADKAALKKLTALL